MGREGDRDDDDLLGAGRLRQGVPLRGALSLKALTAGPYPPGQMVLVEAHFIDAAGQEQSTFPGTDWSASQVRRPARSQAEARVEPFDPARLEWLVKPGERSFAQAQFRVRLPDTLRAGEATEVWVGATYRDLYNRSYQGNVVLPVEPRR